MPGQEPDVGPAALSSPMSTTTAGATDEAWFRQLFVDAYRPLVAYARRRSASWGDADDIVSEVFTVAWRRRAERDPDRAAMPWLYGIAANVARNHWRSTDRRQRLQQHLEAQPGAAPFDDPADRAGSEVRAALERLSFDDREILRLAAWEGLTHAEIGAVLGCSTNAVGIRSHRARLRLKAQLERSDTPADDHETGPGERPEADTDGEIT